MTDDVESLKWHETADGAGQMVWVLRRNCSLTPGQLLAIFCSLAGLSLAFAAFWTSQGAWVVLPFAVVECLALGVAFLCILATPAIMSASRCLLRVSRWSWSRVFDAWHFMFPGNGFEWSGKMTAAAW